MIGGNRVLALIPARGGSKRLPHKNVRRLGGKPLISWTIKAAQQSVYIDRVIVSTDDDQIATISREYGAEVPIIRPADLSTDEALSIDVALHTVKYLETVEESYDYLVLLQPTSPLRNYSHIDGAIEQMELKGADCVISVCKATHSPLWCNTLPSDDNMDQFISDDIKNTRSQDLPDYYRINGAIYISKIEKLPGEKSLFFREKSYAYLMKEYDSVDIDSKHDFDFATFLITPKDKS